MYENTVGIQLVSQVLHMFGLYNLMDRDQSD